MPIHIADGWLLFCISFAIMLLTIFIMGLQSTNFYTQDVVLRRFSIMDMEFPSSAQEVVNLIKGIYKQPADKSQKTLRALRGQLYIDFLFMPAAYGCIFLACMKISWKMFSFGHWIFAALAWAQIIPWVLDIIENVIILKKISPDVPVSGPAATKAFRWLEITKWGIALTGAVCSFSAMMYFWLVGRYSYSSLEYLVTIIAELAIFFVAGKIAAKKYNKTI